REVEVHAPTDHDPAAILGVLREGFGSCYVFAVGRGQATFIGASPELLIRREGQRASTVALAGSARRSADPAVDDHLGEQLLHSDKDRHENRIVARRSVRRLRPHAVWVTAAPDPVLVRVADIQDPPAPTRAPLAWPLRASGPAGGRAARPHITEAEQTRGLCEVDAVRRRHMLLEGVDLAADREKVKDAAAVVVE